MKRVSIRIMILKSFHDLKEAAMKRIYLRNGRLLMGIPVDDIADYAIIGAAKIARGTSRFADWSADMVAEFGEELRPHLLEIWERSKIELDKMKKQVDTNVGHPRYVKNISLEKLNSIPSNNSHNDTLQPMALQPSSKKRKTFWVSISIITLISFLGLYAVNSRYTYQGSGNMLYKIDRWTGKMWVTDGQAEYEIVPENINPQTNVQPSPPSAPQPTPTISKDEYIKQRNEAIIEFTKQAIIRRNSKNIRIADALRERIEEVQGPLHIYGWDVKPYPNDIYLVSYRWNEGIGINQQAQYFEVDIKNILVRDIQTDEALARYYGIELID
jgi:hypothetical protein